MSKHKYRKGFREDQVMMSEAYGAMYERRNPDAGTWGRGLKGVLPLSLIHISEPTRPY